MTSPARPARPALSAVAANVRHQEHAAGRATPHPSSAPTGELVAGPAGC
jgi:hypothetical protein